MADLLLPMPVWRFAVTGGRDFTDIHLVARTLSQFVVARAVLVHGSAPGADGLCAGWWIGNRGRVEPHPADWTGPCRAGCRPGHRRRRRAGSDYCPSAGHYRNQEMVDSGLDLLVAFPGGRGTADMTARAKHAGIPILDAASGTFTKAGASKSPGRDNHP